MELFKKHCIIINVLILFTKLLVQYINKKICQLPTSKLGSIDVSFVGGGRGEVGLTLGSSIIVADSKIIVIGSVFALAFAATFLAIIIANTSLG